MRVVTGLSISAGIQYSSSEDKGAREKKKKEMHASQGRSAECRVAISEEVYWRGSRIALRLLIIRMLLPREMCTCSQQTAPV